MKTREGLIIIYNQAATNRFVPLFLFLLEKES